MECKFAALLDDQKRWDVLRVMRDFFRTARHMAIGGHFHCLLRLPGFSRRQRGFTMLDLAVVVAIVAILASIALPNFSTWIQNSQVHNAGVAIQNGIQLARTEAVRRNTPIRFQLTTTLDANCALSTANANWAISIDDVTGQCANTPINDSFPVGDTTNNPAPRIIQRGTASEGARNAVVAAGQSVIVFNSIGRLSPAPAAAINIDITNPTGGTCVAAGGLVRCLRVVITTGGQVRMCEPALSSTDPRGC